MPVCGSFSGIRLLLLLLPSLQLEQQNAQRLQRAEADVASLRQQLEAAQAASTELQGKLKQAQSDAESSRSQLTSTQFGEKALKARVKELEGQLAKAQQQVKEQQNESQPPPPPPPAKEAPAVDMSMLNMMEGQLGRLSEIIRSREGELAQMRTALQAGLDERRELLRQIESLQTALLQAQQQLQLQLQQQQQQYGSAPGSSNGSINGGGGGGSVSGMSSPKSSSGGVPRGLPHVGQHKLNRTGLQSKPRFFK
ncbi:hypothetical protein Vretimale_5597 [Volvox reticuliferus]|uniref:Uncharacterized protein n=1 Tax=Volvox reticuliferus TaxID=1737510 RepID=A0A8J4C6Y7_9CHLO|nr:hypothetical protein Vretifemale_5623 [Volvox reticuliferus]GIM00626.1 hypothetical protein Vretimale_5597 [Volvox reticuliferus]